MLTQSRFATVLVPLLLACAAPAAAGAAAPTPTVGADTGDLVVNGEVIPETAVRREMVYRLGMRYLETRKLETFIMRELENRGLQLVDLLEEGEVEGVLQQGRERIEEEYDGEGSEHPGHDVVG